MICGARSNGRCQKKQSRAGLGVLVGGGALARGYGPEFLTRLIRNARLRERRRAARPIVMEARHAGPGLLWGARYSL